MMQFKATETNAIRAYKAVLAYNLGVDVSRVDEPSRAEVEEINFGMYRVNNYERPDADGQSPPYHAICTYLEDDFWKVELGTGGTLIVYDDDGDFSVAKDRE